MSIGPASSIVGSVAGTFLAQTRGSDLERAQQDSNSQASSVESQLKAEMAAGVGQADGDNHQTADRDADGRRLWDFPPRQDEHDADGQESHSPKGKDPSGQCGGSLDLSG